MNSFMRVALGLLLVCGNAAVAAPKKGPAEPPSRLTKTDKAAIVAWARGTLADPYELRSTGISEPTVVKGVEVVCIEFNAKNGYGGYAGIMRFAFAVTDAGLKPAVMRSDVTTATCWAPEIVLRPFPELAAIK